MDLQQFYGAFNKKINEGERTFRFVLLTMALILSFSAQSAAQSRYDHNWIMGLRSFGEEDRGIRLNFNTLPVHVTLFRSINSFYGSVGGAPMSTYDGKLIYYADGCRVIGNDYQIMPNGRVINAGEIHDQQCKENTDYSTGHQSLLSLPDLSDSSRFNLFHIRLIYDFTQEIYIVGKDLLKTSIVWDDDRERYVVSSVRDSIVYRANEKLDFLLPDELTAVLHANGTDFWLVVPAYYRHAYHFFLYTKDGIIHSHTQDIDYEVDLSVTYGGQVCFSPDGNVMARVIQPNGTIVYDFDRSAGLLSFKEHLPSDRLNYRSGAAISPNSRYLYVATRTYIHQYDLSAGDIQSTKTEIAQWDGTMFPEPIRSYFSTMQLGPDCKIYCRTPGGGYAFHVIHEPDEPGEACRFEMNGMVFNRQAFNIPNIPHYRTAYGYDRYCDSVRAVTSLHPGINYELGYELWPNPAGEEIQVSFALEIPSGSRYAIYDQLGREVLHGPLTTDRRIEVGGLAPGVYCFRVEWGRTGYRVLPRLFVRN